MSKIQLYCDFCNYKKIIDNSELSELNKFTFTKIMTNIPQIEKNKLIKAKYKPRLDNIKCPSCGRLILPKNIVDKNENKLT